MDDAGPLGETMAAHRPAIAGTARRTTGAAPAVDVDDPLVAEADEVFDGQVRSDPLVVADGVDAVRPQGPAHDDERHLVGGGLDPARRDVRAHQDDAVDA